VEAFSKAGDAPAARVLFPASDIARDDIPEGLAELGAKVDRVTAYRMVTLPLDAESCGSQVDAGQVQVVTFASPSAMEGLLEGLGEGLFRRIAEEIPAAAIGPTTARALHGAGWRRVEVAPEPTLDGLAAAAGAALEEQDGESSVDFEAGP
jgi:uroporphyrinogen-III synthase